MSFPQHIVAGHAQDDVYREWKLQMEKISSCETYCLCAAAAMLVKV